MNRKSFIIEILNKDMFVVAQVCVFRAEVKQLDC